MNENDLEMEWLSGQESPEEMYDIIRRNLERIIIKIERKRIRDQVVKWRDEADQYVGDAANRLIAVDSAAQSRAYQRVLNLLDGKEEANGPERKD